MLRYHFVLCTKYRHELLTGALSEDIKKILQEITDTEGYTIEIMETDKNHIHLLIEARPIFSPYNIIHKIKFVSTFRIWKKHSELLKKYYWKEKTFWSDGYFVETVGTVNLDKIKEYVRNQ